MSTAQLDPSPARRIPFATTEITAAAQKSVARVVKSGWVTTGHEVAAFEREFGDWVRAPHAVAIASCTTAIELSLRALELPAGSKVLTSTMTSCGAVHAIIHAGLVPVLADINPITLMPDEGTVARACQRADGVDAMVVLHFAGQPAPVRSLAVAAALPPDRVIEDAAHAVGTWVENEQVGSISAATCFSYYATRHLPIAEGGMVTTADEAIAEKIRRMRSHGMSRDAWKRHLPRGASRHVDETASLRATMTDIQAAIGRAHLTVLSDWQQRRSELADRYDHKLFAVPGITRPARPVRGLHAWHLYVIKVDPRRAGMGRDQLMQALSERGIGTAVHFIPTHHQPYFQRMLGEGVRTDFPLADREFERILSLPLHPGLSDGDVDRVCDALLDVVSHPHLPRPRPEPRIAPVRPSRTRASAR